MHLKQHIGNLILDISPAPHWWPPLAPQASSMALRPGSYDDGTHSSHGMEGASLDPASG